MARIRFQKTSFSSGEIAPRLLGRTDLRAYENGARRLRNVLLHPTGGIRRRPGLRFVDLAAGRGRLVAFEFNSEQVYLLVVTDRLISVYKDGGRVASFAAPWTTAQIAQLNWTQSADTLLVVHPDVPPKRITRQSDTAWDLSDWAFHLENNRSGQPHGRFVSDGITLQPSGTTGTVTLTASSPVFTAAHLSVRLRVANREVEISGVISPTQVRADVKETLVDTSATEDWTEQAFSPARGWPVSVCFHQDRLVIGGSRDLPNHLWLSKASDLFNFDLGEGLDDEGIDFAILSDQVNAIRHVFSGRHLQVFTSGAEWMVTGDPLSPTTIQLHRQTRIGSPVDRTIPPRDVDGATLFVPRSGPELREFLFADTEQAYQASDLAMLAHHLIERPVDMDYDKSARLLQIVMGNGTLATLTVYRQEQVSAWTLQETSGRFLAVAAIGEEVYVLVERDSGIFIEAFDNELAVDSGLTGEAAIATDRWLGIGHLESREVRVIADGIVLANAIVTAGEVVTEVPARRVQIGLPYFHVVEPLPPALAQLGVQASDRFRPVSVTFRLLDTVTMTLDRGRGLEPIKFRQRDPTALDTPLPPFTGDHRVRCFGWRDGDLTPLWRIEQSTPLPFTLLSVSTELSSAT